MDYYLLVSFANGYIGFDFKEKNEIIKKHFLKKVLFFNMPRTKKGLQQKRARDHLFDEKEKEMQKVRKERQRIKEEKRQRRIQREKKVEDERSEEVKRQQRLLLAKEKRWDRLYSPRKGQDVLYREHVSTRDIYFFGMVTDLILLKGGDYDFKVSFGDESQLFPKDVLFGKRNESCCFTNVFVSHLKDEKNYDDLMRKTWMLARDKVIFNTKRCRDKGKCRNTNIGHLVNFKH